MALRRLAGDTLIYGSGYILGRVLNYLLITVYLTWKFDGEQEQYGLYTDFYFYVALVLVLLTLRMETTFFRFGSEQGRKKVAFSQAALALISTTVIWLAVAIPGRGWIAEALQYPGFESHVLVLALILAFDVLVAIPFAQLRLEQRPVRFAVIRIMGILVNIVMVLIFLEIVPRLGGTTLEWAGDWYREEDRLLYVFVANLIGSGSVFLIFLPQYLKVRLTVNWPLLGRMLKYTLPLIIVGLAGVINQSSYITFQKHILPDSLTENLSAGGVYAAATRIAILMSLFITAFNYAAEPFFFQNAQNKDARQIYADVAKAFTIAGSVLFVGVLMYIDIIQLILGTSFRGGMGVVPILLMAFFLLGLYYNFSIWYKLTDRTRYGAYISFGGALITVVLNILLIRQLEVVGSAWAALACYAFMATACYFLGRRYYPIPYDIRRIALIVMIGLFTFALSALAQFIIPASTVTTLVVNTLLFAVFLWALFRLEGPMILSVLRRERTSG